LIPETPDWLPLPDVPMPLEMPLADWPIVPVFPLIVCRSAAGS
jgi:hypothetical protein